MRWPFRRPARHEPEPHPEAPSSRAETAGGDEQLGEERLAADEPIRSAQDDLLDRAPFAAALARTVERAPHGSGFVIAVTGPWGEGKTSVLNMAIEQLKRRDSVEIVQFNPWLFSGAEDLLGRFFVEVAAQLPSDGPLLSVASGLRRYAGAVAPLKSLPWVGGVLQTTGELAQGAAGLLSPDAASVHARGAELREALVAAPRPIAIFVDDIDRLRPDEINDVMRLVRLVGDFPNLVYVLAFERARVEEALGGSPERRSVGSDYLEKIIQAIFEMPVVRAPARERVLQRAISDALGDLSRLTFSQDAFVNVYAHGLRDLFGSLRDVRRVANALPATIELVGDEVDVSDVLALEALRVLEPESYGLLAAHPATFTTTRGFGFGTGDPERDKRDQATVAQVLAAARNAEAVRALVTELFPAARRHMGGNTYGSDWESTWRRERRVASGEVFEIYLARGLEPGAVPQALVRQLVEAIDDRAALDAMFEPLDGEALERLLQRLLDYEGQLDTDHPELLIGALLDRANLLRTGRRDFYDPGADIALSRVLLRILRGRDPAAIELAVRSVNSTSLWGRYELVLLVGHVDGAGSRLVSEPVAKALERELVDDVLTSSAERLRAERDVAALLGMAQWTDPDALRERIAAWLEDPDFVLALLRAAMLEGLGGTMGRAGLRRRYQLSWRALVEMATEARLAEAVQAAASVLEGRELDDVERIALEQALRYSSDPDAAGQDLDRWGTRGGDEE